SSSNSMSGCSWDSATTCFSLTIKMFMLIQALDMYSTWSSGTVGAGANLTSQESNIFGIVLTLFGFSRSFPGANGMNEASMCMGAESFTSMTCTVYSDPMVQATQSMPSMLVTWLRWAKMSRPHRMKSAASNVGSCSRVT